MKTICWALIVLAAICSFAFAAEVGTAFDRGMNAHKQGNYEEAIEQFTQAIRSDPSRAEAYLRRGNSYGFIGERASAIADFTRAIEVDPNYGVAYNNRGNAYFEIRNYKKATLDARKACDLGDCALLELMGKFDQLRD